MMKILVTGKAGQLGSSIKKVVDEKKDLYLNNFEFIFIGKEELNLKHIKDIRSFFKINSFDVVINCAAYTNVDKAESNQKESNLINHIALKEIARISKNKKMNLIHISTDFVFNGFKGKPYIESDSTSPLNIYGETKLAGELAITSIMKSNAIIIRTSWLYSEFGNNFVSTILNLAKKNNTLNVVSDQIGTPTYVNDLAQLILYILSNEKFIQQNRPSEIFHFSNNGESSWYEFASEIIRILGINCQLNPINTEAYPLPAKRPKYSILSKKKIIQEYDLKIRHWKDALKDCCKKL
jgi:dTDP-4-dehydrorhamnose reductase